MTTISHAAAAALHTSHEINRAVFATVKMREKLSFSAEKKFGARVAVSCRQKTREQEVMMGGDQSRVSIKR
jgi:hypothetical protein